MFGRECAQNMAMEGCVPGGRLWIVIAIAVALRLALVFEVFPQARSLAPQTYEAEKFKDGYDMIAWNLVQGNGYRVYPETSLTMLRSPGFVLLLAAIFMGFGKSLLAVQVVQFVFSCVTAVLTYTLGLKVGLPRFSAILAGLIFFFFPGGIVADTRSGLESTLTLFMVVSVLMVTVVLERRNWATSALLGLVNGVVMLIKSSVAPVLPALFIYGLWKEKDGASRRQLLGSMLICGFVSAAVMMPWIARNYLVSGRFVPTMTLGGLATFQGAYAVKHWDPNRDYFEIIEDAAVEQMVIAREMGLRTKEAFFPQFYEIADEVRYYRELGSRAMNLYLQDPGMIFRSVVHNGWAFWLLGRTRNATMLNAIVTLPLLGLALGGLILGRRRGLDVFPLLLISVVFMLPHLLIISMARYFIPLVPYLAILAAVPLTALLERILPDRLYSTVH